MLCVAPGVSHWVAEKFERDCLCEIVPLESSSSSKGCCLLNVWDFIQDYYTFEERIYLVIQAAIGDFREGGGKSINVGCPV